MTTYSADFFIHIFVFIVVIFKIDDQEWSSGKPRWRETITPDANEKGVYDNRTKQIRMVRMTVCCLIDAICHMKPSTKLEASLNREPCFSRDGHRNR